MLCLCIHTFHPRHCVCLPPQICVPTQIFNITSSALFFYIMQILLAAFACEYREIPEGNSTIANGTFFQEDLASGTPTMLYYHRDFGSTEIYAVRYTAFSPYTQSSCWSKSHSLYVAAASISLLLYFPLASFIFPNLQFADTSLDLKFEPSYLVLYQQARLVIAAALAWYPTDMFPALMAATVGNGILGIMSMKFRPCLVPAMNELCSMGFLAAAWSALVSSFLHEGQCHPPPGHGGCFLPLSSHVVSLSLLHATNKRNANRT